MKIILLIAACVGVLTLSACGGSEKAASQNDPVLQRQADVARASLQEKADAMARQGSMSPPPATEKAK